MKSINKLSAKNATEKKASQQGSAPTMKRKNRMTQTEKIRQMEEELAQPLAHFRAACTTMAEHQSQQARPFAAHQAQEQTVREFNPSWFRSRWVLRLAPISLLIALTLGLVLANKNDHHPASDEGANTASMQADLPANAAQVSDTAFFSEMDQDLSANAPQPMAPLEGTLVTNKTTHANQTQVEEENAVEK